MLYYNFNKEPPKKFIGDYLGPYRTGSGACRSFEGGGACPVVTKNGSQKACWKFALKG